MLCCADSVVLLTTLLSPLISRTTFIFNPPCLLRSMHWLIPCLHLTKHLFKEVASFAYCTNILIKWRLKFGPNPSKWQEPLRFAGNRELTLIALAEQSPAYPPPYCKKSQSPSLAAWRMHREALWSAVLSERMPELWLDEHRRVEADRKGGGSEWYGYNDRDLGGGGVVQKRSFPTLHKTTKAPLHISHVTQVKFVFASQKLLSSLPV